MWFGDGGMGWGMAMGWGVGLLVLVLLVWLVVQAGGATTGSRGEDSPELILKRRYARGEIDREEYEHRLGDLRK